MLRILDGNFNILETIPKCFTVSWISRFTECGSFTLVLPNGSYKFVKQGNFVRYGDRYGIIEYISKNDTNLTVRGYDLKAVAAYRIAEKGAYNGNAETVVKSIMSDNSKDNRCFDNFTVAETQKRGEEIEYEISDFDSVENHIKKICENNEFGYDVSVSGGRMIFDVKFPQTRDIVYSLRRKNISGYEYLLDALSQKNIIVCETKSEGFSLESYASKSVTLGGGTLYFKNGERFVFDSETVSVSTGLPYVYAQLTVKSNYAVLTNGGKNLSDTSDCYYICLGKAEFNSNSVVSGYTSAEIPQYTLFEYVGGEPVGFARKEKNGDIDDWKGSLAEISETATAEILNADDYKTKWDLGDFVTVKIELFNETIDFTRQITEAEESFSSGEHKVTPTFGKTKENIIRKIIKGRI